MLENKLQSQPLSFSQKEMAERVCGEEMQRERKREMKENERGGVEKKRQGERGMGREKDM